jgi:hypothetical protein
MGTDAFEVKLTHSGTTYTCANTVTTNCNYKQSSAATTFPVLTSMTKTDTTMVLTGTSFYTAGYTTRVSYMGIDATSVVVDSATQVTATWTGGVPLTSQTNQDRDTIRTNL